MKNGNRFYRRNTMIHTHTYKNGLRVVLEPVSTVRSVAVGIWVLTGSRNEHTANMAYLTFWSICFSKEQRNVPQVKLLKHLTQLVDGSMHSLRKNILVFMHMCWIHMCIQR